jgi:predicted metal-dependent HD superfamily phosphohydrolase
MTENNAQILEFTRDYVTELYKTKVDPKFVFHNLHHTQQVVIAAEEVATHYSLNQDDHLVLILAAWFHDTGFRSGHPEEHEKESIRLATEFLQHHQVNAEVIHRVSSCIQATRMPQSPLSQVEKILCDADLYHLGTEDFKKMNQALRQEQEAYTGKEIPKKEWRQRNIEFLESHQYFTDYCQQRLEAKKQNWIRALRKKQGGKDIEHTVEMDISPYSFATDAAQPQSPDGNGKLDKSTDRGIQTVFRTTSENHISLSSMADSKANIMISVNAIIISIMFSVLLGRLEYYPHLMIPTMILATVSVATIVFAILATLPKITGGQFTEDDIRNKRTNLLFFGNFYKMDLEKYNWAMNEMIKDKEFIYSSIIKDIYYLGIVLAKKYHYLRISYTIFMYGLVASVIAFGIAVYFSAP